MSKVWILGAGASAGSDQCLPLGSDVLESILASETWDWPSEEDRQLTISFVDTFQQNGCRADIEDCLTYLDCALSGTGLQTWKNLESIHSFRGIAWDPNTHTHDKPFVPIEQLRRIRAILTQQIVSVLLPQSHELCERHATMFAALHDSDHIITLNYDLIVEKTIEWMNLGRTLTSRGKRVGKVYSLYEADALRNKGQPSTGHVQRLQQLLEEMKPQYTDERPSLAHSVRRLDGSIYHLHGAVNWLSCPEGLSRR